MRDDFISQIETTNGKVLSTADGPTIMRRMSQADRLDLSRAAPSQSAKSQSLSEQRNTVMKQAAPKQSKNTPPNGRAQTPQQ